MNRKSLRAHLANHYESLTLSADRRDAILAMVRDGEDDAAGSASIKAWWVRAAPFAAAAAVLLAVMITVIMGPGRDSQDAIALGEQVGRQIVMYHERYIDLDVSTEDFEAMKLAMDQLEFEPHKPAIINEKGLRLVGARYCAMYGCAAVQMRFVDEQGRQYTLYEVKPDERLQGAADRTVAVDDVSVKVWQEQGLLIGLAGPTL